MINPDISLADFLILLDSKLEPEEWPSYDPATIMLELNEVEPILLEKINVLQMCMYGVNKMLAKPEFLIWMTDIANNNEAEFEFINMPSVLEFAWCIEQAKRIVTLSNQEWAPTTELKDTLEWFLNQEGFSVAPPPFEFLDGNLLQPGQTSEDIKLKELACKAYIKYMTDLTGKAND